MAGHKHTNKERATAMSNERNKPVWESTVEAPEDSRNLLELEVRLHLSKTQDALNKLNVWGVRVQAEIKIDGFGNRYAHYFPMRRKAPDPRTLGHYERVKLEPYYADGVYVSFNDHWNKAPYTPANVANGIRIALEDAAKKAAAE
jgi:hypothetical protein